MMQACDEAIVSADKAVGHLVKLAQQIAGTEDLVVIISADHGENFGEWSSWPVIAPQMRQQRTFH